MPGCHKTINCPHCGLLQRSNNLKRHIESKHKATEPPAEPPTEPPSEPPSEPPRDFDFLYEKYDNNQPKWIQITLPNGMIAFCETNWGDI